MTGRLMPQPVNFDRTRQAKSVRADAATLRDNIPSPYQMNNGEIDTYTTTPMTFTKGLPHDDYGIVGSTDLTHFVTFINQPDRAGTFGYSDPVGQNIRHGSVSGYHNLDKCDDPGCACPKASDVKSRKWESPLAGHVYSLQGADDDSVAMPKAPALGSGELAAEMAEVYAFSLLRDFSFRQIDAGSSSTPYGEVACHQLSDYPASADGGLPATAKVVTDALEAINWYGTPEADDAYAEARRLARLDNGQIDAPLLLRGSTEGAKRGPYISQFMLMGSSSMARAKDADTTTSSNPPAMPYTLPEEVASKEACAKRTAMSGSDRIGGGKAGPVFKATDGYIAYGVQQINQRITSHAKGSDHMVDWANWIDVQNGADYKGRDLYETEQLRFITTPRDLATYVHFDQLYQAYLNACLLMLSYQCPFDFGLPESKQPDGSTIPKSEDRSLNRDAFATFGGPHLLSLMTEVASRALKFARRQKFNIHLRARPEAVAGVVTMAGCADQDANVKKQLANAFDDAVALHGRLDGSGLLDLVKTRNDALIEAREWDTPERLNWIKDCDNHLLSMAFPEGSPMHPSYAAGHASVAGACVTILKAFFEMFDEPDDDVNGCWSERPFVTMYGKDNADRAKVLGIPLKDYTSGIFEPEENASRLCQVHPEDRDAENVKILGELDKLAANISIGRDMAGVHYYTDYYESLRMGERLAISILQEQMLTYPEPLTMRLKSFDGEQLIVRGHGDGRNATVEVQTLAQVDDGMGGFEDITFTDWFTRSERRQIALNRRQQGVV